MVDDYELTDTIYRLVLKYHKIDENKLDVDETNFLFEQCQDMDSEIFNFIQDQKEALEEWKKDNDYYDNAKEPKGDSQ